MAHLFQVGAGSGGMVVLDLLARDARVTRVTLVEPDVYKPHNVHRHLFPPAGVGRLKAELAADWLRDRRPELAVDVLPVDLTDPAHHVAIEAAVAACDVGVCAADNEVAKYFFDRLMRTHRKPWALGEVLSGGIGGWVHRFAADGPCYGCVASHLQRAGPTDAPPAPAPDYSAPGGPVHEATIPASRASISAIASLHAVVTLELLAGQTPLGPGPSPSQDAATGPLTQAARPDWTSLLLPLARVAGVFDDPYRPVRLAVPKSPTCLVCSSVPAAGGDLDAALDQALGRLAHD